MATTGGAMKDVTTPLEMPPHSTPHLLPYSQCSSSAAKEKFVQH